jgi:hypothetical protein
VSPESQRFSRSLEQESRLSTHDLATGFRLKIHPVRQHLSHPDDDATVKSISYRHSRSSALALALLAVLAYSSANQLAVNPVIGQREELLGCHLDALPAYPRLFD